MASLEYIDFTAWREVIDGEGTVTWERDPLSRQIDDLPQLFWQNGEGWIEVNHWALERAADRRIKLETVKTQLKHLRAYAQFLEEQKLDWRHFPIQLASRAIVRFRGDLVEQIERGSLTSSTARSRIGAVIGFYRYADAHKFISPESPMWREKSVVIQYYDSIGFKRSLTRAVTDLAIPNRSRPGVRLEDGLLPINEAHMTQLLDFTSREETQELHLMLTTGFFTGARLGTITTLRIENLEQAHPDPFMKGFFLLRVGPGTGVATKFDVEGDLLVPDFLLEELKRYAYSTPRLKRETRAKPADRSILFLTTRGRGYSSKSIDRLMTGLRRDCMRAGLKFMARFKFHQTRATYGTWLMKLALGVTTVAAAVAFARNALFHKRESTTFGYVRFLENSKGKQEAAEAFNQAFTGLGNRKWDEFDA